MNEEKIIERVTEKTSFLKDGTFWMFLIIIAMATAFIIMLNGCQSAPNRADFKNDECFYSADCMYRNSKNPDKSACAILSQSCADACKEKRAYDRLTWCKTNKIEGLSENECRLMLNQK